MKIKSEMLKDSAKSHASPNVFVMILIFLVMFCIIQLAESIVPYILISKDLMEEYLSLGIDNAVSDRKQIFDISTKLSYTPKVWITSLYCTLFGTLISILYCRCFEMRSLRSMGIIKKGLAKQYLLGLGVGAFLISALILISATFGSYDITLCKNISYATILIYIPGWFLQGMSEEFIFRGYLMNTIGGKHSPVLALIISSVAFSLAHVSNPGFSPLVFVNLALFGAFAGLYMLLTDNIWGVSAIHSIWNCLQGNFYGISVSGSIKTETVFTASQTSENVILTGGEFGIEGSIFTTIILSAASVLVFMKIKKNKLIDKADCVES